MEKLRKLASKMFMPLLMLSLVVNNKYGFYTADQVDILTYFSYVYIGLATVLLSVFLSPLGIALTMAKKGIMFDEDDKNREKKIKDVYAMRDFIGKMKLFEGKKSTDFIHYFSVILSLNMLFVLDSYVLSGMFLVLSMLNVISFPIFVNARDGVAKVIKSIELEADKEMSVKKGEK